MQNFLKFGDKVIVKSNYEHKEKNNWGLLSAEGFFTEKLTFEQLNKNNNGVRNIRNNVFELVPVLNFEFHTEFLRILKFYEQIKKIDDNNLTSENIQKPNLRKVLDDQKLKLTKLQKQMDLEKELNKKKIAKFKGKFIRYEDQFQLMHFSSRYFITSKNICSNTSAIGYIIEMSKIFSKEMILKIKPRFKSFQNGDYIQYNDEVKIQSQSTEFYLAINFNEKIQDFQDFNIEADKRLVNLAQINFTNNQIKYGMFFNHTSKNGWYFLHFPEQQNPQLSRVPFQWYDFVQISHFESGSVLQIKNQFEENQELIIKEQSTQSKQQNFLDYLWQFDMVQDDLEQIINNNLNKIHNIVLRNVFTNKVIALDDRYQIQIYSQNQIGMQNINCKINCETTNLENPLLTGISQQKIMVHHKDEEYTIEANKNYFLYFNQIEDNNKRNYIQVKKSDEDYDKNEEEQHNTSQSEDKSSIDDLSNNFENSLEYNEKKIQICEYVTDESIFSFQKISNEEKEWVLFSQSLVKVFNSFLAQRNFENHLQKINTHLIEVIMFIFNEEKLYKLHFPQIDSYKNTKANYKKQVILREIKLFELLIKVLDKLNTDQMILKRKKTFMGNEENIQNNHLQSKLQDCQQNVYYCLLYMIKNNQKNQEYLSKWVNEFINQFLDSNSNRVVNGFNYENLIKKIFKNNHQLIKKKLTANKINNKLQKIKSFSNKFKKMLQVLKFLYVVFGKNKIDLNKCVYQLLFVENRSMFLQIKKDQGTRSYYIESPFPQSIQDQKIFIKNYNHLFEKEYNFIEFFEVLVLYAKMGNKRIVRKLQVIYDSHCDIFIRLVKRERLNSKFRIIFLKMILYVWLTFLPNQNVQYSFRIKNFQKIKELRIANFFQDVTIANPYKELVKCIYETSSFHNLKIFEIDKKGEKIIQNYPEMTFKMICALLNYGILRNLEDIKQILEVIFSFIQQHNLISISLLNFINDYFQFNNNYSLNLVLKDISVNKFTRPKYDLEFFNNSKIKIKCTQFDDKNFNKFFDILIDYTYTNETKIFQHINKNFINILLSYFCMNMNKKDTFILKQKILFALSNIFNYRKNFLNFIKQVNYIDIQQQENYQIVKNLKDNIIEINKNRKSVEQNKKLYANVFDQIIINFFSDKKIFEIFQFYDGQLYKNIYENFQQKEKNIYLFLLVKSIPINNDLQNLVKPLQLIDNIIEAIEVNELYKNTHQEIFQQAMWILFILCKDHQINCTHFWKRFKKNFFKYLQTPKVSLFLLLSEIVKNNQKLQKNIIDIQEILDSLFSLNMQNYYQKPNNIVASFFLLKIIQNLIISKNKIIFKNQFMIISYLKIISTLNSNIKNFLSNPNNIKWEFHEITQKNEKIIFLNPEINIYCKMLDVLSLLAKGSYNASDNIVRNMFTLKNLMEVLCNEYPLSLKMSVLNFFINSYFYVDKSKIFPIINEIIFSLDEKFFRQITKVIDQCFKNNPLNKNFLYSNDFNGIFEDFSNHYISLNLSFFIILLIKIHKKYSQFRKLIQLKISEPLKRYVLNKLDEVNFNKNDINKKLKILRMLIPLEVQSNSSTKLDELIQNRNKHFIQNQDSEYQTEIIGIINQIQQFVFKDNNKKQNKKCSIKLQDVEEIQNANLQQTKQTSDFKVFFTSINKYSGQDKYINQYKDQVNIIHKEEFKQLYKSVFHASDAQEETKEFFQVLNIYLRENVSKITQKEKLFCIDLITQYIKSLNPQDIPLYEWTEDTIQSFDTDKGFLMKQNYLGSNGTIETILYYLENEQNHKVLIEILNLSNLMLLGGNLDIQNLFYYQIKENQNSKFLQKINEMITNLFKEILISTKIQNKLEKRKLEQKVSIVSSDVDLAGEIFDEEKLYHKQIEVTRIRTYILLLKNIYKFLQLLTEGQYLNFQNYLTGINQVNQDINIISTTAIYFKEYLEFNFIDDLELRNNVLEFLIEIIQGPHIENQQMIFTYKIVDMCKSYIYELGLNEKIYEQQYNDLLKNKYNKSIKKIIKLFYSMLENNLEEKNIESMKNNMDQFFFKEKLKHELLDYFNRINLTFKGQNDFEEILQQEQIYFFDEEIRDTFDYFFLSRKLGIDLEPDDNDSFDYLQFYESFSGNVEIKLGTELKTVYFIIHPICKFLNEKMKQEILSSIESKDKNERMTFFFDQMTTIFLKVQNEAKLSRSKILYVLKAFKIRECFVIFSLMLNAFIFFFMGSDIKSNVLIPDQYDFNLGNTIMNIMVLLLMNICILRLILFIWLNFKITFYGYWRNQLIKYSVLIDKNQLNKQENIILEKFNETNLSDEDIKDILRLYITQISEQKVNRIYVSFYFYFYGIYQFIINTKFLIYLSYILFCVFGQYYEQFFFYSFLLIEISLENPSMNTVFLSISLNKKQFVLLIIFLFCIVIIFGNFAYYFASDTFWNASINSDKGENVCTSIWQCVITIFSLGPRSSGSVGDVIERQSYIPENRSRFYFRYFFDLLCFIVINVIFMNILFGIIIDTFKVLRSRNNEIFQQKNNLCYVCYLTRTEFEKEQQDFELHIKKVHNLWQYIFFVYYLYNKYQTDYSGIEAKVRKKLDTKDINWIPYLATQKISQGQKVSVLNQIKIIKNHLQFIKQKIDINQIQK